MSLSKPWKSAVLTGPLERPGSFEAVFEACWPGVHRLLLRIVGDPAEAEDLALEAFVRLNDRPELLQAGQNPGAWLRRVAANLGYNALRDRRRRNRRELAAGMEALDRQTGDPQAAAERRLEADRVRTVLAEMPSRAARMLFLRSAGYSYAELAEAVGVAPGSVGPLLSRAEREFKRRYRRAYGEQG